MFSWAKPDKWISLCQQGLYSPLWHNAASLLYPPSAHSFQFAALEWAGGTRCEEKIQDKGRCSVARQMMSEGKETPGGNWQVSFLINRRRQDEIGKADGGRRNQYRPLETDGLAHREKDKFHPDLLPFFTTSGLFEPASLSEVALGGDAALCGSIIVFWWCCSVRPCGPAAQMNA